MTLFGALKNVEREPQAVYCHTYPGNDSCVRIGERERERERERKGERGRERRREGERERENEGMECCIRV